MLAFALAAAAPVREKRVASRNLQWLAARGRGYSDILSDTLKYLNDPWWRASYQAALNSSLQVVAGWGEAGRVLDVGSGTGTLAVMAARAGAVSVRSCERKHWAAMMAMATAGLSDVADRVRVVHMEGGCAASADEQRPLVLVHDILGTPVRMGVAPVLHSAQRTLDEILGGRWLDSQGGAGAGAGAGGEGGVVTVPAAVKLYVQVVSSPVAAQYSQVPESVLGFNLSFWHALHPKVEVFKIEHTASQVPYWPLTARLVIAHWDFMDPARRYMRRESWKYVHACLQTCLHVCIHARTHARTHACMHACMCVCVCACVHANTHICSNPAAGHVCKRHCLHAQDGRVVGARLRTACA